MTQLAHEIASVPLRCTSCNDTCKLLCDAPPSTSQATCRSRSPWTEAVGPLRHRVPHQLEETMDDLDDIGFDGQVLNSILRAAHLELRSFIARCDQAMMTTEQRILHTLVR